MILEGMKRGVWCVVVVFVAVSSLSRVESRIKVGCISCLGARDDDFARAKLLRSKK